MIRRLKTYYNRYRVALLSAAASVIGVFGYVRASHAMNWFTEAILASAGGLAGFFTHWVVVLSNTLASFALSLIGFLVDFGLQLNESVITKGIVPVGWAIARDVANLGFTIGLIAIAFATILRMEQYGAKKLLGKLVIVALLINFSLLIPGVILDGANVFSHFFLSKIFGGADSQSGLGALSEVLAQSMKVNQFANIKAGAENALSVDSLGDVIKIIVGGLFIVFFQVFSTIAMGAIAYMVFYRYIILTFLLIAAPLAWISLFIPAFGSQWSKWWDTFFRWTFFLPCMTFFLYLTVLASTHADFKAAENLVAGPYSVINDIATIIPVAAQMAVLIGLIFGSLIVSQKFGIAGAAAALGVATSTRKFMLGAIQKGAVRAVKGPAVYLGARPLKAGAMGLASLLNKPALRWIPGVKGAVAGLSGFGQRGEEINAYQKQYLSKSALPDEEFKKVLKGRLPEGPVAQAALLAEAASRGMLKEIKDDPKKLIALAGAAKETNPGTEAKDVKDIQALLGVMPSLAEKITDGKLTTYEAARRFVSADKVADLTAEELGNSSVIASFTQAHWKNLAESPKVSAEQMTAAQNALKELAGDDIIKLQQDYATAQMEIDRAKEEGVPETDEIAKDEKGRTMKDASGKPIIARKGLRTLRREKKAELNARRDNLFLNQETVTDDDREHYAQVIQDKRMNDPKFIANFKTQYGHEPTNEELILIERGRTYKQLEDSQKQIGGLFYRPYPSKGTGGGTTPPPTSPTGGGPASGPAGTPAGGVSPSSAPQAGGGTAAPAPAKSLPEMMAQLRAKQQADQDAKRTADQAAAEAARAQRSTGGFLGDTEEAEERAAADNDARIAAAQQEEAEKNRIKLPPTSLPGARQPTPPPPAQQTQVPPRAATNPPAQPGAGAQPTQVPPRAPTQATAQPGQVPPAKPSAQPRAGKAAPVEPRQATIVPPRAPSQATAEQGVDAEAKRREDQQKATDRETQRQRDEESARRVREENVGTADAAERIANANRESAKSEEQRRKSAEKIGEAAEGEARAAEKKLDTLTAALGVTKETGKETEKILREVEGGAEAAKKTTEELKKQADLTIDALKKAADFRELLGDPQEWVGRTLVTPDESRRVIRNIVRNNVNPDESVVVMDTTRKGETASQEDQLTLRQLYNFTEKGLKGVKVLRK